MQLESMLQNLLQTLTSLAPKILYVVITLVVGWLVGRASCTLVTAFLRRIKIDETLKDSVIGRALERIGMSVSKFFGVTIKWVIYTIAVLAAINILGIGALNVFITSIVNYLPNLIGGILIFIIGIVVTEILARVFSEVMKGVHTPYTGVLTATIRFLLYLIVIIVTLNILKIDVSIFYSLINALFWGASVGLCVGLGIAFGWGLKDYVAKNASKIFESTLWATQQIESELKVKEYSKKIKELENKIKKQENIIREQENLIRELSTKREVAFKELERVVSNLDKKLNDLIGNTGVITFSYGSYKIEVKDPSRFPWTEVMVVLMNNGFKILVEKIDNKYVIEAQPSISR